MEDEINLIDYWRVILKQKKIIVVIVFMSSFSSVLISLVLPKSYKAEATILTVGGQTGGGGMMAMAAQMGISGLLSGLTPTASSTAQLLAILKSRTLAERVIGKFGLMKVFFSNEATENKQEAGGVKGPTMEEAVRNLKEIVQVIEDKKNLTINLSAEMQDPQLAATIVNGYLEELRNYLNENTFTVAKRNRIFIEQQLERNKAEFLELGKELSTFYVTNRISNVVPRVDVTVSFLPGISDASVGSQKKVDELQKQANEVGAKIQKTKVVQQVPQLVYLQYLTLQRDLLGQLHTFMVQQYEMAKIEETKEDLVFHIIDPARVPIRKFKPNRRQIIITTFVMSLFLAIFYVFFREYLEKIKGLVRQANG